jgi:hypothetical protein
MKTTRILTALLFAFATAPLFASTKNIADDVIKMFKSGVTEESIIDFVHKTDGQIDVTADDMIALSEARVPRTIIKAILDESDSRNGRGEVHDVRTEKETVVVQPRYVAGYYSPWYYDPFWYGYGYPRYSFGFGIGYTRFYGGGRNFHGGGHHGGGGHGGHRGGRH